MSQTAPKGPPPNMGSGGDVRLRAEAIRKQYHDDPLGDYLLILLDILTEVRTLGRPVPEIVRAAIRTSMLQERRRWATGCLLLGLALGLVFGGAIGWLVGNVPWACR